MPTLAGVICIDSGSLVAIVFELGSPETLTRIKLSLTEEAMEWTMDEGEEPERLTPE